MSEKSGDPGAGTPKPPADVDSVTATTLASHVAAGDSVRILDLRNRDETDAWHIDGPAVAFSQVPLSKFVQAQVTGGVDDLVDGVSGEGPITTVCAEGDASDYVAGLLVEAGHPARNLADGMAGWADVYLATTVSRDPTVIQYDRPATGCLAYLVVSDGEAAVVDPLRAFTDRYLVDTADRDAEIVAVFDTHLHADHLSGRTDLAATTDATAYVPAETAARGVTGEFETLEDGDVVRVGTLDLRAVALPGHTTDVTGYAMDDVLLTGDSLFLDAVARPDLQERGDPEALAIELHRTLTDRLATFDDESIVAPGHHRAVTEPDEDGRYVATLGDLRNAVDAFEVDETTLVERLTGDLPPEPANADRIVAANRGDVDLEDEEAFELELGPNNCAA